MLAHGGDADPRPFGQRRHVVVIVSGQPQHVQPRGIAQERERSRGRFELRHRRPRRLNYRTCLFGSPIFWLRHRGVHSDASPTN